MEALSSSNPRALPTATLSDATSRQHHSHISYDVMNRAQPSCCSTAFMAHQSTTPRLQMSLCVVGGSPSSTSGAAP